MKTIILCGGQGTRLQEETEYKPKPMVSIGGMPILLHIMNIYAYYGYKEFILCLGYKGDVIKDYFLTLSRYNDDFFFDMRTGKVTNLTNHKRHDYKITFVETGLETKTSGRVLQALKYIGKDPYFMVTYGDGVSNINISNLIDFHKRQEKKYGTIATISTVHPQSKYGKVTFDESNVVTNFEEKKPILDDYINGGFHIYNRKVIPYLKYEEMLEDSLIKVTNERKLSIYRHEGFWHCMDTMKDFKSLNKLWAEGKPWAVWENKNSQLDFEIFPKKKSKKNAVKRNNRNGSNTESKRSGKKKIGVSYRSKTVTNKVEKVS